MQSWLQKKKKKKIRQKNYVNFSTKKISDGAISNIKHNLISGANIFDLNNQDLRELFPLVGDRKAVESFLKQYRHPQHVSMHVNFN